MNTMIPAAVDTAMPVARSTVLRACLLEAKYEFLRVLRTPGAAVPTLMFPPLFYLLFGIVLNRHNAQAAHYLFATYSVFGLMAPSLFGFGVAVAIERERGWLALKRVAPMPPGGYLLAKLAMAMTFGIIIFLVLATMAFGLAGVQMAAWKWIALGAIALLGVLPFCALGLMIGAKANANAAPAFVNLIYLPMAFLSGLWLPLAMLPKFIAQLAPAWPAYHLSQLALMVVGQVPAQGIVEHVLWLVAFSVICFGIARRWLARAA